MVGFPQEEVDAVRASADTVFEGAHVNGTRVLVAGIGRACSQRTLEQLLHSVAGVSEADEELDALESEGGLANGRVVLLCGAGVQQAGAVLNDLLCQMGVAPCVVTSPLPRHDTQPLQDVVSSLRSAHARYHGLVQPLATLQTAQALGVGNPGGDAQGEAPQAAGGETQPRNQSREALLGGATLVLNAVIDAGEVPSANVPGEYRTDEGHCVVVDGLVSESERIGLLDWLTAPGHDHSGLPPSERWEQACVDRVGDQATWGLRPDVLMALKVDPPAVLVSVQTKLAALYPEWEMCHMPAEQLSEGVSTRRRSKGGEDEGEEEDEQVLSSFVGNAIMVGDPCAYHVDADPTAFHPSSPWVHNYGFYHNREPGRPLFVSVVLYLNAEWRDELHAETLVLDPTSQTGLFVRPAPGRLLIMDQDVPHRISAPSRAANGAPRYSLVWKLVLFPREEEDPRGGCDSGDDGLLGPQRLSLCRPEWGQPLRVGGANARAGQPLCAPA